jgi:integrase
MFSEPTIHRATEEGGRHYVSTYIDGKRYRLYNGRALGVNCNPNRAQSVTEQNKQLTTLCYQLKKKLEQGWNPWQEAPEERKVDNTPSGKAFSLLRGQIEKEAVSKPYRRDLLGLLDHFVQHLKEKKLEGKPLAALTADHVEGFLERFKSSGTNYMSRRRTLSALFSRLNSQKLLSENVVAETGRMKQAAHLHLPYKKGQLQQVLGYVRERHEALYLCCLLMYGCLLRPHQEIRLLQRGHFDEGLSKISLSGNENKSRRIRTVLIPGYVREELVRQGVVGLLDGVNIFSRETWEFNESYFNTAWTRIKDELVAAGLITRNHTLYSFRHTGAVNMYLKTKDPYKIQQAFGHSSLRVTLTYLRNLGLVVDASLEDLPELVL